MKMLKWFRARAGTWALVALCSFTAVGTLSTAHELRCGDELAEGFVAGHRPGSHSVAATRVGQEPAHCVLCHWTRTFRPSLQAAHPLAPAVDRAVRVLVHVVLAPEAFLAAQPPLRAPPTSSLVA